MLKKITFSILTVLFMLQMGVAQNISWSIQASGNLNSLSFQKHTSEYQYPYYNGTINFGTGVTIFTNNQTRSYVQTTAKSKIGYGAIGKMGVGLSEKWTYRIGVGVQFKRVDIGYKTADYTFNYNQNDNTGITPTVIVLNGFQSNNTDTQYSNYYTSSTHSARLSQTSNFLQFQFIPLEIDYQLIKNRLSIFTNFQLLPVLDSQQKYDDANFTTENNFSFNQLQMGVEAGLSFKIFDKWTIQGSYFRGLTNVYNSSSVDLNARWNSYSLGVEYQLSAAR